jgi:uncharacterized SAM-binding protein YcdF (DUF218 family)
MKNTIAIIMGSAVLPDGSAGAGMRRRVAAALHLRDEFNDLIFIPTGGIAPDRSRSEADAMRDLLLHAGVKSECIIPEPKAKNTLQNTINASEIIRKFPSDCTVIVCSDNYHIPRCRVLLNFMGISTISRPMPGGRKTIGWMRWAYYCIREAAAIPFDVIRLLKTKIWKKI